MSIQITAKNVAKSFDKGKSFVLPDLSLTIRNSEFFTLLGPSGCGKTTFLRIMAGFNELDRGELYFDDRRMNDVPSYERNIGMVFQNYAIFPHLTVRQNVEYGLKLRKVRGSELKRRTDEILEIVRMGDYAERQPAMLSGGQQQRVALARAIVINPSVLLMDEPLSNLDAKLRVEMRSTIRELQRRVGITTVYVTHDQEEALAVSDRIAVMRAGMVQQVGTPQEIYQRPANEFVSTFIGFSNLFRGTVCLQDGALAVRIGDCVVPKPELRPDVREGTPVLAAMRADDFEYVAEGGIPAKIRSATFLGQNMEYAVDFEPGLVKPTEDGNALEESIKHMRRANQVGETVRIRPLAWSLSVFSEDGSTRLTEGGRGDAD